MGDQDTQTQQERSWWAADGSPEDLGSSPSFDEPLEWPDATAWEPLFEGGPPTEPAYVPEDFGTGLLFGPAPGTAGDDDGGLPTQVHLEPLPQSIWAQDPSGDDPADAVVATVAALGGAGTAVAAPTPAAVTEPDPRRQAGPAWLQRFHVRHGSAAIVALACCVSLVLLGMFLSVRARDDLPTQTSDFQPTGTQVATQGSTSLPPPTTAAPTTTLSPPSTISLSDLIPADAGGEGGGTSGTTGGTSGTTGRTTAPATTAAPSRAAAPSGGAGGGGSSAQPTNTTAAPDPEPTSPPATSPPPVDTTTTPTTARRVQPTIPDFDYTIPSYTMPSRPSSTPGSPFRLTDD